MIRPDNFEIVRNAPAMEIARGASPDLRKEDLGEYQQELERVKAQLIRHLGYYYAKQPDGSHKLRWGLTGEQRHEASLKTKDLYDTIEALEEIIAKLSP